MNSYYQNFIKWYMSEQSARGEKKKTSLDTKILKMEVLRGKHGQMVRIGSVYC